MKIIGLVITYFPMLYQKNTLGYKKKHVSIPPFAQLGKNEFIVCSCSGTIMKKKRKKHVYVTIQEPSTIQMHRQIGNICNTDYGILMFIFLGLMAIFSNYQKFFILYKMCD